MIVLLAGTDTPLGVAIWILGFLGSSGLIGTVVAKRVKPVITPLELLDQVQEERDGLVQQLKQIRVEADAVIMDIRNERARGEAWRREALDRRDDLYRLSGLPQVDYDLPPLPQGLI